MTVTGGRRAVVVHSSDEMYGADKILLQVIEGMRSLDLDVEVWLPDDLEHGAFPLCEELTRRGVAWQHRRLPILRRAYLRPSGMPTLLAAVRRGWTMLPRRPPRRGLPQHERLPAHGADRTAGGRAPPCGPHPGALERARGERAAGAHPVHDVPHRDLRGRRRGERGASTRRR